MRPAVAAMLGLSESWDEMCWLRSCEQERDPAELCVLSGDASEEPGSRC